MSESLPESESVADAYLALLRRRGVEYLFANAGTDFAPIIEALARAERSGRPVPRPILATHENLAMSMAHGYAMLSHRIPAVMVHVSVGTGNALCGLFNAARENVPILLTAGRTPLTEGRLPGARDAYIHWGQEMFDQSAMVRELVKWDYELRNAEQLKSVVDRALALAASEPRGPVYLSLPREVLATPMTTSCSDELTQRPAAPAAADEDALSAAAAILSTAERPLIITSSYGRDPAGVAVLASFAEQYAIPVVQFSPRHLALPTDHPMQLGFDPTPFLEVADAILVLECDVPWIPGRISPLPSCKVVHLGLDPLFGNYPVRGFPCDLAITGEAGGALIKLSGILKRKANGARTAVRRERIAAQRHALHAEWSERLASSREARPIHPVWVSHCISAAKDADAIVVSEYSLISEHCSFVHPGSYFRSSVASGLGWGLGAALGAKLAAPERLVIAAMGDGAYLFANPVAGHHAAALHELPILVVVFNDGMWNAVRRSTLTMYPDGAAAKSNHPPFTRLEALPAFEQIVTAAGGYGERVEDPAELPAALDRALHAVRHDRRQALLNVICQSLDGPL